MTAIARTAIAAVALFVTAIAANVSTPAAADPAPQHVTVPVPTPKPVV